MKTNAKENVKSNPIIHKKYNTLRPCRVYPSNANLFKIRKFFRVIHHISRIKEKTRIIGDHCSAQ